MSNHFCKWLYLLALSTLMLFINDSNAQVNCGLLSDSLSFDATVKHGKLSNGFSYYIKKNDLHKDKIAFCLTVKAGVLHQDTNQAGLAHLLEHMGMRETNNFPNVFQYLESLGVKLGADANAGTGTDNTFYWFVVDKKKANISQLLLLLSEMAHGIKLNQPDIDAEKKVVLNEIGGDRGYSLRLSDEYYPLLIRNSGYARRYQHHQKEVHNIENLKHSLLINFYEKWYCANRQAVAIVGDVDVDTTIQWIQNYFSGIPSCGQVNDVEGDTVLLKGDNLFRTFTDPEITNPEFHVFYKQYKTRRFTINDSRLNLMRNICRHIISSRCQQINSLDERTFNTINCQSANVPLLNLDPLLFTVKCKPGKIKEGYKALIIEIERLKKYGFSDAEFEEAKKNSLREISALKDISPTTLASRYNAYFLSGEASPDVKEEYKLNTCLLSNITRRSLDSLVRLLLADYNRDIFLLAPEKIKNNLPSEKLLKNWSIEVKASSIHPVAENKISKPLIKPGELDSTIRLSYSRLSSNDSTVAEYKLSNGVKLIFKSVTSDQVIHDKILINVFRSGGLNLFNKEDVGLAEQVPYIIAKSGLADLSPSQFKMFLREKNIDVMPYLNKDISGFYGSASQESFEEMMQVFYKYFSAPVKNAKAFAEWKEQEQLNAAQSLSDPQKVLEDSIKAIDGVGNRTIVQRSYQDVRLEEIFQIYRSVFNDIGKFTFVVVGNFNIDTILPVILKYIQPLKCKDTCRTIYSSSADGKAYVKFQSHFDHRYSASNTISFNIFAALLQDRLTTRLRKKEGGVYSVMAQSNYNETEKKYRLSIDYNCLSRDADRLQKATKEEIQLALKISEEEFSQLITQQIEQLEQQQNNPSFLLYYLSRQASAGNTFSDISDQITFLKKLNCNNFIEFLEEAINNSHLECYVMMPSKS